VDRVISEMDAADNDGYYLKMAVAWAISVCFVKYPERTMIYLRGPNRLDDFTYNKSLQKIVESYRVDDATKDVIRGMKRK
jgi:3-methyladenine DNA glycosylase AlkD